MEVTKGRFAPAAAVAKFLNRPTCTSDKTLVIR